MLFFMLRLKKLYLEDIITLTDFHARNPLLKRIWMALGRYHRSFHLVFLHLFPAHNRYNRKLLWICVLLPWPLLITDRF